MTVVGKPELVKLNTIGAENFVHRLQYVVYVKSKMFICLPPPRRF